jgi:hypothetical protein
MKIAFIAKTWWTDLHKRMAEAVNEYTPHEALSLGIGHWDRKKGFGGRFDRHGVMRSIRHPELVDEVLDWADVLHFSYTCSPFTLENPRPDVMRKKIIVFQLATRWKNVMLQHFPGGSYKSVRFVMSAEGWDRYPCGEWQWEHLPQIYPIESPEYLPIPMEERRKEVSMSPRVVTDYSNTGDLISAPRRVGSVKTHLRNFPFRLLSKKSHPVCMQQKASAWLGVDDVVNPLLHQSSMEYLSLGVPCINRVDGHLIGLLARVHGRAPPLIHAELTDLRAVVKDCFKNWSQDRYRQTSEEARQWMEQYCHPRDVINRYIAIYERG